jgi:hypothetical protein
MAEGTQMTPIIKLVALHSSNELLCFGVSIFATGFVRQEKVKSSSLKYFHLCIPRTDEFLCAYGDESMCCMMIGCMAVQVDEECLFNKTSPMHVTNVDG